MRQISVQHTTNDSIKITDKITGMLAGSVNDEPTRAGGFAREGSKELGEHSARFGREGAASELGSELGTDFGSEPTPPTGDICGQIREHLINAEGHNRVRRYFSSTVTMSCSGDAAAGYTIEIVAGDGFTLDMIERRLGGPLRIAAQFALGTTDPKITYRVDESRNAQAAKAMAGTNTSAGRHAQSNPPTTNTHPLANRINRPGSIGASNGTNNGASYGARFPACPSLKDFLVGTSNRLAYESIKQLIAAGTECPPIFVHGSCGVGKTHLLRGGDPIRPSAPPGVQGAIHHRRGIHQWVCHRDQNTIGRCFSEEVSRARSAVY